MVKERHAKTIVPVVDALPGDTTELQQTEGGTPIDADTVPEDNLSTQELRSEWPAMDTSSQAWLFVLGAVVLEFLVWGYGYAFGVLQEYYTSPGSPFYGSSTLAISSIGTIGSGIQYILGILTEPIYRAYPQYIKRSMWISLVISSGAFFISAWATEVWQLIILQGIIFGLFSSALYFPVIIWLSEWFFLRRSTAAGLIFGGSSGGGVILPFMFRYLLDGLGYPNAMRVWAALFLTLGAIVIPLIKPRIPVTALSRARYARSIQFPDMTFVWTSQFKIFAMSVLFQRLAYTPITVLLASYAKTFENVTTLKSTIALALLNFSGMLGAMLAGYLSDRVVYWKVMIASGTMASLAAALVLGFAQNIGTIYGFGVCFGIASGGYTAIWTAAAKSIREESSGAVFLTFQAVGGIATVVGPLIAGALQTSSKKTAPYGTHGFRDVVIYIVILMASVSVMGLFTGYREYRKAHRPRH